MEPFVRIEGLLGKAFVAAVVQVTLPVAALLVLYWWASLSGTLDPERFLRRAGRWRPTLAAALSAVPGCAGSIAVSRLFVAGVVDQGSLLAAHLATSGDAAFVLLVGRPRLALVLFAVAFVVGAGAGTLASWWWGPSAAAGDPAVGEARGEPGGWCPVAAPAVSALPWYALVALTAALAAAGVPTAVPAAAAVGGALVVTRPAPHKRSAKAPHGLLAAGLLAAHDAAEITLWVTAADVVFEIARTFAARPVDDLLHGGMLAVTVAAALVGAIPGCGPQILLTRIFLAGGLPLPAMLANTVGQHGDAIFPLLGRDRRAALRITVVQAALAVALGILAVRLRL